MSIISIRVPDKLLREMNGGAKAMHIPRAEYIRLAIQHLNQEMKNHERRQQLIKASLRVRGESMKINAEFSRIENDPED